MQALSQILKHFLGWEKEQVSIAEKLVSLLGAVLGIYLVCLISFYTTDAQGAAYIVPSMGAAAVLLFAVPHGKLSQPWALFGGNLISAVVGVTCYKLVPEPFIAAALAVGLAIGCMHLFSCVHPPGGATALAAVIGGEAVHSIGYSFVFIPIFVNVVILFLVAMVFNSMFPWRRYPISTMRFKHVKPQAPEFVSKSAIEKAMREMDVYVDVTVEELQALIERSLQYQHGNDIHPEQVMVGRYFANGKPGAEWSVRKIIDESKSDNPEHDMVVFEVVEGSGKRLKDSCTRVGFTQWAAFEVKPNNVKKIR